MKRFLFFTAFCAAFLGFIGCELDEGCLDAEAPSVLISSANGDFYIDAYEASRANATDSTMGTGVTLACDYAEHIPWGGASYEDAHNACLDAGKRLCTKDEWMAACGTTAYPYGDDYVEGNCNDGGKSVESLPTGSKKSCRTAKGVYDMTGNLSEWVEGGIIMGGNFNSDAAGATCSTAQPQSGYLDGSTTTNIGFRCCKDASTL